MMLCWPPSPKLLVLLGLALLLLVVLVPGRGPLSLRLLRLYPKKLGSGLAGWAAGRRLPPALRRPILGAFARHYKIALDEAELPLEQYPSLQAFFTRRLKGGLRPQEAPVQGFVNSPVDARIVACGRIEAGTLIQAKGLPYRLAELLRHDPDPARFEGGWYLTLYLSPQDYHRIHVPFDGRVLRATLVEGELWPVNDASTLNMPRLYERNRRAAWIAQGKDACGGLDLACVLVGATHVGGVIIEERWLEGRSLPKDGTLAIGALPCAAGEDLGQFQFGSTVVLLVGGPRADDWRPLRSEGPVKVGMRLGSLP